MPKGTVVEVITLVPTGDGVSQKVGIAGTDLTRSWEWTPESRDTHPAAPIDFYRVRLPGKVIALERSMEAIPDLEVA